MTFLQLVFYAFSAVAVVSGTMVVASKNPVHSALFLVLTFIAMAGVWVLLQAEFLALVLVLVYVGAVMTLFLFVVMMLSVGQVRLSEGFVRYLPLGMFIVLIVVGILSFIIGPHRFGLTHVPAPASLPSDYSNIADLGSVIYTNYAFPFEIAAVLLLTAIVAAITLTHGKGKKHKKQSASAQIAVQAKDRVRLVSMPSETNTNTSGMTQT